MRHYLKNCVNIKIGVIGPDFLFLNQTQFMYKVPKNWSSRVRENSFTTYFLTDQSQIYSIHLTLTNIITLFMTHHSPIFDKTHLYQAV